MVLGPTSQELESLISASEGRVVDSKNRIKLALKSFVDANENVGSSANYHSNLPDPQSLMISILDDSVVRNDALFTLLCLKTLKIFSRKQLNRGSITESDILGILAVISPPLNDRIGAEGSNVLLNICHEVKNVQTLIRTPGVQQLISFLTEEDEALQANAAGAIQSVCFLAEGREHVRLCLGIPCLVDLLVSDNAKVVLRAVGAIHNLSSDPESIHIIRECEGIPSLVLLLTSSDDAVSGSAAGALQNISREVASRIIIKTLDVVPPLSVLLSSTDPQTQLCAAGALLNIVGPDFDIEVGGAQRRRAFCRLISLTMATAAIYDCVFEKRPCLS
uniref:Armadillo repeat-containing protein 8 n=1 Tax=Polytomella parva TaxID=51329 RepID=A0A7S0UYJ1_9CHLO|mmetsp:Transcript_2248/g.3409  ORF Transcript_2248/g.3409 Transcript_2248/m.3409 type:complete len:334 (+) Transcript_2248:59-1060(+)